VNLTRGSVEKRVQQAQEVQRSIARCLCSQPQQASNRIEPWEYDRALYKKRNEIERLFRDSKASAESSPASRNSMSSSSASSTSPSSSKRFPSVNTPSSREGYEETTY